MIFFDLDGTLLDDASAVVAGLDALYARYGASLHVTRETLGPVWQDMIYEYFPRYLRGEISLQEQRRARLRCLLPTDETRTTQFYDEAFDVYLAGYERAWTVFPDVRETLEQLAGAPLGVITNGDHAQQMRKLEWTRLAEYFQVVVTSEASGVAKPDRRIFLEACRQADVEPAAAVYVGDSWETDVVGSRDAGLRSIWIRRDASSPPPVEPGIPIIDSLVKLPEAMRLLRTLSS